MRSLPLPRPLRWVARPRLRGHRRPARRGPGLSLRPVTGNALNPMSPTCWRPPDAWWSGTGRRPVRGRRADRSVSNRRAAVAWRIRGHPPPETTQRPARRAKALVRRIRHQRPSNARACGFRVASGSSRMMPGWLLAAAPRPTG